MKYIVYGLFLCVVLSGVLFMPSTGVQRVDGLYIGFFDTDQGHATLGLGRETFGCEAAQAQGIAFVAEPETDHTSLDVTASGMLLRQRLIDRLGLCAATGSHIMSVLPLPNPLPQQMAISVKLNGRDNIFILFTRDDEVVLQDVEEQNVILPDTEKHALVHRHALRSKFIGGEGGSMKR